MCVLEYEIKDKSRIKNKNAGEEDWEAEPELEKLQGKATRRATTTHSSNPVNYLISDR